MGRGLVARGGVSGSPRGRRLFSAAATSGQNLALAASCAPLPRGNDPQDPRASAGWGRDISDIPRRMSMWEELCSENVGGIGLIFPQTKNNKRERF